MAHFAFGKICLAPTSRNELPPPPRKRPVDAKGGTSEYIDRPSHTSPP